MRGAQINGGIAENIQGDAIGGTTNNQNFHAPVGNLAGVNKGSMTVHVEQQRMDNIIKLIAILKEISQSFPNEQQENVEIHLSDLKSDLNQQEKPNLSKLKTRIIGLLSVAIAVAGTIATATDFANNVFELSNNLKVPIDVIQPQLREFKELQPQF